MRSMLKHVVFLSLSATAVPAFAQDSAPDTEVVSTVVKTPVQKENPKYIKAKYEIWGGARDQETFDNAPADMRTDLHHNLRLDAGYAFGGLRLRFDTRLIAGELTEPAPSEVPFEFKDPGTAIERRGGAFDSENIFDPQNIYVEYRSIFLARLGLQTSNYGMGIVANDGSSDDLFNQPQGADRGLRALLGLRPFALSKSRTLKNINLIVAGDLVYRDDNASLLDDDIATQVVGSLFFRDQNPVDDRESTFLGLYGALRSQTDARGDELDVFAIDLSGKKSWRSSSEEFVFDFGFESALLTGESTRAFTQSGQAFTDVLAFGTAVETGFEYVPVSLAGKLKAGYASGDANSDDNTLFRFRFDPNYKVGLILFDHYIPAMTRKGYERATDPTRSGQPPKGVEGLISDGAVENAIYVNPQILFGSDEGLLTGIGFLWAQSAVPVVDPFNTFKNGGTPRGVNDGETSRDLGFEVNAAAQYRMKLIDQLVGEAKLEYGILFPGKAFDDARGESAAPQNLVRARLSVEW